MQTNHLKCVRNIANIDSVCHISFRTCDKKNIIDCIRFKCMYVYMLRVMFKLHKTFNSFKLVLVHLWLNMHDQGDLELKIMCIKTSCLCLLRR